MISLLLQLFDSEFVLIHFTPCSYTLITKMRPAAAEINAVHISGQVSFRAVRGPNGGHPPTKRLIVEQRSPLEGTGHRGSRRQAHSLGRSTGNLFDRAFKSPTDKAEVTKQGLVTARCKAIPTRLPCCLPLISVTSLDKYFRKEKLLKICRLLK